MQKGYDPAGLTVQADEMAAAFTAGRSDANA
jgi:hypothetical protein